MTEYGERLREVAAATHDAADWTAEVVTFLGLGFGAADQPQRGATFLFLAAGFKLLARHSKRMADDPPRQDFWRTIEFEADPFLRTSDLSSIVQGDELSRLALRAASVAGSTSVTFEGAITAFERLQGAVNEGALDLAEAREAEATRWTRDTGQHLLIFADQVGHVAEELAPENYFALGDRGWRWLSKRPEPYSPSPRRGVGDLDQTMLAFFMKGGMPYDLLNALFTEARMDGSSIDAYEALGDGQRAIRRLGLELSDWENDVSAEREPWPNAGR